MKIRQAGLEGNIPLRGEDGLWKSRLAWDLPSLFNILVNRSPDSHAKRFHDSQAAGKLFKVRLPDKKLDQRIHGQRPEAPRAKEYDPGVTAGWESAQVPKLQVECQKGPSSVFRGLPNLDIRPGEQPLVCNRFRIVTELPQDRLQMAGEILVELQLHGAVVSFHTFSLDSSAA